MFEFVLKAAVMYFMALIIIRLLGKRALGELGPFDFVVMTGVGHTVVSVALDRSIPFYEGVIILATLAGLEYLMGYLALKNQGLANLITGKPVVLIDNGKIIKENLAKEKFNIDDLLQELRKQGVRELETVDKGILESCGGFTVLLKEGSEPVTREDLGLKPLPKKGILTIEPVKRAEFFARQQDEGDQPKEDNLSLPDSLKAIEERLDYISNKIDRLERRTNSDK